MYGVAKAIHIGSSKTTPTLRADEAARKTFSVVTLLPIFLVFVITHVALVSYGFVTHLQNLPEHVSRSAAEGHAMVSQYGWWFVCVRFLQAFSMGAGTLTGIEAVSNGMLSLKETRVRTGKRTMAYMATSLSFLAAFLLLNYFLYDVQHVEGQTLNAWQNGPGIIPIWEGLFLSQKVQVAPLNTE